MKVLEPTTKTKEKSQARIRVMFHWTELTQVDNKRFAHKERSVYTEGFTFDEIRRFHNEHGGNPELDYGYLAGNYGHCAVKLPIKELRERVESRDIVYKVNIDDSALKFFPVVRTAEQLKRLDQSVVTSGALD